MLILSLFPGAGLSDEGFTELGHCVVKGPDIIWGQCIQDFKGMEGKFDLIIGGPPCQLFSKGLRANHRQQRQNLIPEFLRVVEECKPRYAIMENIVTATPHAPAWPFVTLCDSDLGGATKRIRRFWLHGFNEVPTVPTKDKALYKAAAYSVLASSRKNRFGKRADNYATYPQYFPDQAAFLQGYPGKHETMMNAWSNDMSQAAKEYLAVQLIGNGWTHSMSRFLAEWVTEYDARTTLSRNL